MLKDIVSPLKSCFKDKEHVELRAQLNRKSAVSLVNGNIVGNSRSEQSGVCSRVYKNGYYGFASSAVYDENSCKAVLNSATRNAEFMCSHLDTRNHVLKPLDYGKIQVQNDISNPEQTMYIEFAKELDSYISNKYKDLKGRWVSAVSDSMEKLLVTSDGFDSHSILPRSYLRINLSTEYEDGSPFDYFEVLGGGFGTFDSNFKDPKDYFDKIDRAYEKLRKKQSAVFAEPGIKTCVLSPFMTGMLSHEAVGHTVEADLVIGGSVAGPNLNKIVASEKISLVDFAHTAFGKQAPLPVYVDDEGTKAEDQLIIDKGKLVGYMNNRESAEQFGMKPNGNARAFAFSDEPLIRMRNTAVLPGTDKLEDMIASIDDGYYFVDSNNGQADTTGEFMFGVTLGFEIKNGKIGRPIKDTTISGIAFEMLKTVDMVSDEMEWVSSGMCGKKQPMPVGMGGPSVKCKVNVGGR